MSQAATTTKAIETPAIELILDDGEPLDSNWQRIQIGLLVDVIRRAMIEREREDFFVVGNMFVYFSREQAHRVAVEPPEKSREFRGPDVFFVAGVDGRRQRDVWTVWEEDGRYPDLIVELLSPSTERVDRTTKKDLYERTFRTPEYFLYDHWQDSFEGFRLDGGEYRPLDPDDQGRLWSQVLGLWLGRWQGEETGVESLWLRLYDADGRLIPTPAEAERLRAEAAEAEVARLRARLAALGEE